MLVPVVLMSIPVFIYVYVHARVYAHIRVYVHVYMHMSVHMYMCIYMYVDDTNIGAQRSKRLNVIFSGFLKESIVKN